MRLPTVVGPLENNQGPTKEITKRQPLCCSRESCMFTGHWKEETNEREEVRNQIPLTNDPAIQPHLACVWIRLDYL